MARQAVQTERITGPNNEAVIVRFYGDASVRLEVKGGPWAISQAWLPGGEGANILLRLEEPQPDLNGDEEAPAVEVPASSVVDGTVDTTGTD